MTPSMNVGIFTSTIGITSAFALGCAAGITYLIRKQTKLQNSGDALSYLTINIINTEKECEHVINDLRSRCAQHHAVGFDCEWVTTNGKRSPVALLQLSSFDGHCLLFRLSQIKSIPKSLKDLLEDEAIYKVGVAPTDDAKHLRFDYNVDVQGALDIRHLAVLCNYEAGGLAALSKSLLGIIIDKNWKIRCSNWEAENLSESQINYAAADAHIAIRIFVKLVKEYHSKNSSFLRRMSMSDNVWNKLNDLCRTYADITFKSDKRNMRKQKYFDKKKKDTQGKSPKTYKKYTSVVRSKPLYHNCYLKAPDGELLCTCDKKKALWYVQKKLADILVEEPLTVQLRFEPSGRCLGEGDRYYQLKKENVCVVCGSSDSYIRKNVVPREYRKFFPDLIKEHSSHDVLLLCVDCHQRSNALDRTVREWLARLCSAPIETSGYIEDHNLLKVRSAARALLYKSEKLPVERKKFLENSLLQHYPQYEEVTEELLKEAANVEILIARPDYEPHGQKVVDYYIARNGLLEFEKMWRQHFLDTMRPKYLPELWSVHHNEERLQVRLNEGLISEEKKRLLGL